MLVLAASPPWAEPAAIEPVTMWIATARFGNVFQTEEPKPLYLQVEWPATRPTRTASLSLEVHDAYGTLVHSEQATLALTAGESSGHVSEIGTTLNGLLTVEAVLRNSEDVVLARATTTIGVVPPLPEQDPARSAIGYFYDPHDRSELKYAEDIATQVAALGIRWIKVHYRWDDPRPERPDVTKPGWLTTRPFERWVTAFDNHGVHVLGQISRVARWASSQPERDGDNHFGRGPIYALVAPKAIEDWSLMVRTLMERTSGKVDAWEIGNEPEGTIYWMGSVEEFSALVIASSLALNSIDPDLPLVVNMVNTWDKVWAREFLLHAGPVLDVFGFHYASRETVNWIKNDLLAPRELTPAIWDTEAFGNTEAKGRDRMFSSWLDSRAAGTSRLFHFVYHLPFYPTVESEREWISRFGQFPVNADYTPRIHAIAIRTLSDLVGAKDYASDFCVARDFWGYVFDDGGQGTLVLSRDGATAWKPDDAVIARFKLPRRVSQVVVTDFMGNRTTIAAKRRKVDVPLIGALTFIEGASTKEAPRLRFKGYVGADGRFVNKRRNRYVEVCTPYQRGYQS